VLSQLLLAIPMTLLYELGLLIARFYVPKPAEDEKPESEAKDTATQTTT
jgi:sec-independent protein translocase protein TatC